MSLNADINTDITIGTCDAFGVDIQFQTRHRRSGDLALYDKETSAYHLTGYARTLALALARAVGTGAGCLDRQ